MTYAVDSGKDRAKVIHGARRSMVGKEFFDTIGIPILQGRGFRNGDEATDSIAAIVNERVVRDCWPGENPLGRRIEMGTEGAPGFQITASKQPAAGNRPRLSGKTRVVEVVGVVRNVRDGVDMAAKELPPIIYVPLRAEDYARPTLYGVTLMARGTPGVDAIGAVRREIAAIDTNLTPYRARSMTEQIDDITFMVQAALWTYGCIGAFGLILASVGLAGVTAYSVSRRRREIGIRMALGARQGDVLGLVMKEGALLVGIGTVLGLAGAGAGTRAVGRLHVASRQDGRHQHVRPGAGVRCSAAAGRPGPAGVLRAGAKIHARRSGGGVAPGIKGDLRNVSQRARLDVPDPSVEVQFAIRDVVANPKISQAIQLE